MLRITVYTEEKGLRTDVAPEEVPKLLEEPTTSIWVDLETPTEPEQRILTEVFHFHPLAVEDCITETHLPKLDDYGAYLFLAVHHGARSPEKPGTFATVELNAFLGKRYLVTYHDTPSRSITETHRRLQKESPSLSHGAAFLLHEILDGIVDNFMPILDDIDDRVDAIERQVLESSNHDIVNRILSLKRDVMQLKRVAAPQREVLNRLSRDPFAVMDSRVQFYFRDIFDHLVRITDLAENYRDHLTSVLEAHLSMVSNRLNEVMKVLTVIATIILPLTLITGIYGMNFAHMPELQWRYGYFIVLGGMAVLAGGMLVAFKRKGWF